MNPIKGMKSKSPAVIPPSVAAASAPKAKVAPKTKPASSSSPSPTDEQIASCAYFIWEEQGRPEGREQENWLLAEERLKAAMRVPN